MWENNVFYSYHYYIRFFLKDTKKSHLNNKWLFIKNVKNLFNFPKSHQVTLLITLSFYWFHNHPATSSKMLPSPIASNRVVIKLVGSVVAGSSQHAAQ